MGVLRIEWLYQEKRVQTSRKPAGFLGAGLVGVAFAFGWTPCIGPILAGILAVAGSQDTVGQGVRLLAVYSLGLGVPFMATALMIDRFFAAMGRIRRHYHTIELVSGALLVVIGMLIFTNKFTVIAKWLSPYSARSSERRRCTVAPLTSYHVTQHAAPRNAARDSVSSPRRGFSGGVLRLVNRARRPPAR